MVELGGGIGGINNSKNFRTYASSFTILKKSLTTFQPNGVAPPFNGTLGKDVQTGIPSTSYTNVGGPGDQTASVPIITHSASGNKARLIVQPHQTGVDVKHGSYERYLARKEGLICVVKIANYFCITLLYMTDESNTKSKEEALCRFNEEFIETLNDLKDKKEINEKINKNGII